MNKSLLLKIFLRSFFIHTTLNFRRMQNIGFTMALIPAIREWRMSPKDVQEMLTRHLQMFNTHPYFSGPVLGSVIRLEEQNLGGSARDSVVVKQSLMGPYAAIGDTFFWGAMRPFAAIIACLLAYRGFVIAPLVFLLIYTPAHFWVRFTGFLDGYQKGKLGIEFIRSMDLPAIAMRIRWGTLIILGLVSFILVSSHNLPKSLQLPETAILLAAVGTILICLLLMKKGISQFYILYGAAIIFLLMPLKEF